MVDLTAIGGAISALKTAHEAVQGMIDARDTAVFQTKAIELQAQILSAQSSALTAHSDQFALLEKIRKLEEEMAALEAWNTEKERYTLHEIKDRRFTYILKEEMGSSEPTHQICANCYQNKHKSVLQYETRSPKRASLLVCHYCGSEIYLMGDRSAGHAGTSARRR